MAELEKIRGVNLSGWLTLEHWVTPGLFSSTGVLDERDLVRVLGRERYAQLVERHRENFIQEQDFRAIAARGYNAVRIKVPWFALGSDGPEPGDYAGCEKNLNDAFTWAGDNNLKVLLSLALLPGSPTTLVWNAQDDYRRITLDVLCALAKRYAGNPAFLGIEVLDRPVPRQRDLRVSLPLNRLRTFYREAYEAIREAAGPDPVVVLNDANDPGAWRFFMGRKRYQNVWLDVHLYQFAEDQRANDSYAVRSLVRESRRMLAEAESSRLPVIVGEWSAALPLTDSYTTPEGRIALERVYASEQIAAFSQAQGWFFQTWRTSEQLSSWDARLALSSFERGMFD